MQVQYGGDVAPGGYVLVTQAPYDVYEHVSVHVSADAGAGADVGADVGAGVESGRGRGHGLVAIFESLMILMQRRVVCFRQRLYPHPLACMNRAFLAPIESRVKVKACH